MRSSSSATSCYNVNTPAPALIELAGVDVVSAHSGGVAIPGVNWRILAGERWVVAGAHGSGKSDLISTAAGLQKPRTGAVSVFGQDISALPDSALIEARARIGIVFKNGGRMFAHMTVAENIALPIRYHFDWTSSQASESVRKILELTGLETQAQNTASAMSGNWLQRVGLARALALKPEVLFLDEPLSGLESRHRQWWQSFLETLSTGLAWNENRPVSVIIATNTPETWSAWGQQFARIDEGRWVSPIPRTISAETLSSKQPLSTPASGDAPHRQPGL